LAVYTVAVQTATAESAWPAPNSPNGSDAAGRKTIPAWLVYGSILLVLVLVLSAVAVWGFGGFKRRTDLLKTVPPGDADYDRPV
jgi:hypothetical protein